MFRVCCALWVVLMAALVFQAAYAESASVRSFAAEKLFDFENQESALPTRAQQVWDEYTSNTLALDDFQPGCEPMHIRPERGVAYRGVVILLHGFTSCPKQFTLMAQSLSEAGYHVLLPVLPGHGRAGSDELAEQYELPGAQNWEKYIAFAHWLNSLAASLGQGEVHIGGLCLGATIAAYALQLQPKLYTRGLLLSPFFELAVPLVGRLGRILGRLGEWVKVNPDLNLPIALDDLETCENYERRVLGRAGYCRVRLSHLIAVARFAEFVKTNWQPVSNLIQTILVENDRVARPGTTLRLLEGEILSVNARKGTCVLNAVASHSFFSPTDLPQPKHWLPELHSEIVGFITRGRTLTQTFTSVHNWPRSFAAVPSCALFP